VDDHSDNVVPSKEARRRLPAVECWLIVVEVDEMAWNWMSDLLEWIENGGEGDADVVAAV